ncbi:MAG: glycosyltransferase family 4 protein [Eubacteriales bacterium]|nr:glycosyltransferase family 4 protein [Eubacteriales bacterium]
MKIGLYIQLFNLNNIMIHEINKGNPGIGGTEYLLLSLTYLLSKHPGYDVTVYCRNNVDTSMSEVRLFHVEDIYEAIIMANSGGIDYFIFTPNAGKEIYKLIDSLKLNSIAWMQNRFTSEIARHLSECKYIKRTVCASREQYDCLIDHSLCCKSVIIKNMVFDNKIMGGGEYHQPVITYMGHLSYSRGFHIVARQWKKIVNKVPNAQLYVLGSATLYKENVHLGEFGIAEQGYENLFRKHITDSNGKLLDSVHFLGRMGIDKNQIFSKTIVGIVNPLSREMGPLSALEMEICSIPVVSINRYGQLEAILNKHTGLLFNHKNNLWRNVVKLLRNKQYYDGMSQNARNYVLEHYSPSKIINQWVVMLSGDLEEKVEIITPGKNFLNDYKWLRIINRKLKSHRPFKNMPSLLDYEKYGKYMFRRLTG